MTSEPEPLTDSDGSELFDDIEFCHAYIDIVQARADTLSAALASAREGLERIVDVMDGMCVSDHDTEDCVVCIAVLALASLEGTNDGTD